MPLMIPLCDLKQQYLELRHELDAAMQAVAEQAHYILGPNVGLLEREIATLCGCQHAVGVGNGTDALTLALRALGIGPGDEVITTPFSFIATTEAIGQVGATPVFADIDLRTFGIDPDAVESVMTPRTKCILPVHLYGQPCDMDAIMQLAKRYGLYVVEDCAQAIGATYRGQPVGSFGDLGCLSFFPSKNLGCFGDGGMVITSNARLAERVEILRRHGGRVKYHHEELGMNSRLDELQAAILRVKLPSLQKWNQRRRVLAYRYNTLLADLADVQRPRERDLAGETIRLAEPAKGELACCTYHQYTILVAERDKIARQLTQAGVGNAVYYPVPLHRQTVHANLGYGEGSFPHAEYAARHCLSLPMYPELSFSAQETVVQVLRQACQTQAASQLRAA
jgi:dTDP-4-amino-4,6-dideoxygalactose transaminase